MRTIFARKNEAIIKVFITFFFHDFMGIFAEFRVSFGIELLISISIEYKSQTAVTVVLFSQREMFHI